MANHKSAKKAHRISLLNYARNKSIRSKVKTYIKKFLSLVETGKLEDARKALPETESVIMKSASKGVYKRNNASRKVSRIVKALKKAEGYTPEASA